MARYTIPIGRVLGIPIDLDYSWFLIVILITWVLAVNYYPPEFKGGTSAEYWLMGAVTAVLFFASIVVHELAHSWVAIRYKIPVHRIILFIFGGVSQIAGEPPSASAEFLIAVVGPLTSFALAAVFFFLEPLLVNITPALAVAKYLALINGMLGLFNLIPGFPLDGGRVFRAIVWGVSKNFRKATLIAASIGRFFGFLFIVTGVWQALRGNVGIRDFLTRSDVPFEWVELKTPEQAREMGINDIDDRRLPVCVFFDGTRVENPTIRQIIEKLGWFRDPSRSEYDVAIYGAGPAGLSAAVYGASEGLKTVVIERWAVGGQASSSPKIENYLGFPSGISGADLAERAREQACRFGAEILQGREGVRGEFTAGQRVGYLADGTKIVARTAVCATGMEYRRLGLPNEDQFIGAGVYYGAGSSEASFCGNEHVFLVGGGNSAGQAALHLSRVAKIVTMVVRGDSLKATLSSYLIDRIRSAPNIEVLTNTEVVGLEGDSLLRAITLHNRMTGGRKTFQTRWLFVCIGGVPHTDWAVEAGVARDEAGYLITGPDLMLNGNSTNKWPLDRSPYYLETNVPGLFAAGDVRHGSVKRFASAVGEGAMAVTFVHRYLTTG